MTPHFITYYNSSLAPVDLNGLLFTCVHFQNIAQTFRVFDFHYISEGIPFLMHSWLLMT